MSIAAKYRPYYTYEDYCLWEGKWELIEECRISWRHANTKASTNRYFAGSGF